MLTQNFQYVLYIFLTFIIPYKYRFFFLLELVRVDSNSYSNSDYNNYQESESELNDFVTDSAALDKTNQILNKLS